MLPELQREKGRASHVCGELQEQREIRFFVLIGLCNLWGWLLQHLPLIKPVRSENPVSLSPKKVFKDQQRS